MATEKQIEANRRNAQKSTGPTTAEGKSKAKFNALKHGMTADAAVLPHEDRQSYEQIREAMIEDHQPVGAMEQMLVELVVVNYWRLLRARRLETETFNLQVRTLKNRHGLSPAPTADDDGGIAASFADPKHTFSNLERYQTGVERSYFRAVEALRKAQNSRRQHERSQAPTQKIGSVSKAMAAGASTGSPTVTQSVATPDNPNRRYPESDAIFPAQPAGPLAHWPAATVDVRAGTNQ
jgi:hypothetical protein